MTRNALLKVWHSWRPYAIGSLGLLIVAAIYLFQLNTPPRLSEAEYATVTTESFPSAIAQIPLYAPFTLLQHLFLRLDAHNLAGVRLPAVACGLALVILFYLLLRRWHGRRIAFLGSAVFAVSGWMLHVSRLAEPQITLLFVPLSLLLLASWLNTTTRRGLPLILMAVVYGLLLYIPGAIWFELASALVIAPVLWKHLRAAAWWQLPLALLLWLCLISPLGYALYRSPGWWMELIGLMQPLPDLMTLAQQAIHSLSFLFIRGPYAPDIWLAHTPILDIFSTVCCVFGGAFYIRHFKTLRTRLLAVFLLLSLGLAAVNGVRGEGFIIPLIYLLVAAGIGYLLHKWYAVFPVNPLARTIGLTLLVATVICSLAFHSTAYFVAWRQAPDTRQTFSHQL